MVCYTNQPPTAPKWLAEKVAKLSQQHMEKQQQQWWQKSKIIKRQIEEPNKDDELEYNNNVNEKNPRNNT